MDLETKETAITCSPEEAKEGVVMESGDKGLTLGQSSLADQGGGQKAWTSHRCSESGHLKLYFLLLVCSPFLNPAGLRGKGERGSVGHLRSAS